MFLFGRLAFFHGTLKRRKQALKRQILLCTFEYLFVLLEYHVGLRRVPVYIYKRRRSDPKKSLAALALFRGTPSARRRYRRTSQQLNRLKNTKITGLPKSIAELFGKRRRNGATGADCESKSPGKRSLRRRGARRSGAVRAEPLANRPAHSAARFPIFSPRFSSLSASSPSFLCSPVPCIRPRPSSRRSPRG